MTNLSYVQYLEQLDHATLVEGLSKAVHELARHRGPTAPPGQDGLAETAVLRRLGVMDAGKHFTLPQPTYESFGVSRGLHAHLVDGLRLIAEAVGTSRGDWDHGFGALTANSDADPHQNATFTMRAACNPDGQAHCHQDGCPPNFIHHPTGLTVTWPKSISDGARINRFPRKAEWDDIVNDCLTSMGITVETLRARRATETDTCKTCERSAGDLTTEDRTSLTLSDECVTCTRAGLATVTNLPRTLACDEQMGQAA